MPSSENSTPIIVARHSTFYIYDGNTTFLVEDVLFKIHRSMLTTDPECVFTSMFNLPPGSQAESQGETDDNPIVLPGVTEREFEVLLTVLYSSAFSHVLDPTMLSVHDWEVALKLGDKFCLDKVIRLAASALERGAPGRTGGDADCLSISLRYPQLFSEAYRRGLYQQFCVRDSPVTIVEAQKLGSVVTASIALSREQAFLSHTKGHQEIRRNIKESSTWMKSMFDRHYDDHISPLEKDNAIWYETPVL